MYAIDASDITNHTTKIVDCNGLGEKIEVIQCRGEDLQLSEKVDLIISEWMGTLLLVSSFILFCSPAQITDNLRARSLRRPLPTSNATSYLQMKVVAGKKRGLALPIEYQVYIEASKDKYTAIIDVPSM